MPRVRRVISRTRSWRRFSDFGAIRRRATLPRVKQNAKIVCYPMSPTALLAEVTFNRKRLSKNRVQLARTHSPGRYERT